MTTIDVDGDLLRTTGLTGADLELKLPDSSWTSDGDALLRTIIDYVETTGRRLHDGETFAYGYWLLRFAATPDGRLALQETTADTTGTQPGAKLAIRYWREQHTICDLHRIPFQPPRPDQHVAVSAGVYEGDPVQGVRYPAPPHMSGWYLTTSRYEGDINTLQVEHLYHPTYVRGDLVRYMALAPGSRFDTSNRGDVWFDAQVAAEAT